MDRGGNWLYIALSSIPAAPPGTPMVPFAVPVVLLDLLIAIAATDGCIIIVAGVGAGNGCVSAVGGTADTQKDHTCAWWILEYIANAIAEECLCASQAEGGADNTYSVLGIICERSAVHLNARARKDIHSIQAITIGSEVG